MPSRKQKILQNFFILADGFCSPIVEAALLENVLYLRVAKQNSSFLQELPSSVFAEAINASGKLRVGCVIDNIIKIAETQICLPNQVRVDFRVSAVFVGKKTVPITEKEADLLRFMLENGGRASRAQILENVWHYAVTADTRTLESHIHRLNAKLEAAFGKKAVVFEAGDCALSKF